MKENQPTFSIITVAFNAETLIEDTMLSVFNQSFLDYEYIIIDGNSSDGTMSIIQKYRNKIDIFVSEPDGGIYDAMNKGIHMASGRYVNFMNCGDSFADAFVLESVSNRVNGNPDVIYGSTIIKTIVGRYLVSPGELEKVIRRHMPFCHQSSFVKLDIARKHLFDIGYKAMADYNMFLQLYNEGKVFCYVDRPLSIYQNDGEGDSVSYQRIIESSQVNQRYRTKLLAYYKFIGAYVRRCLPLSAYKGYRRLKYFLNSRYFYLGE